MPAPERKSPRLRDYDYATSGAYLVTVCARDRACLFGTVIEDEVRLSKIGQTGRACVDPDSFALRRRRPRQVRRYAEPSPRDLWLSRAGGMPRPYLY